MKGVCYVSEENSVTFEEKVGAEMDKLKPDSELSAEERRQKSIKSKISDSKDAPPKPKDVDEDIGEEDTTLTYIETPEGRMVICPNCRTTNPFLAANCKICGRQLRIKAKKPILSVKTDEEIKAERELKERLAREQRLVLFLEDVSKENIKVFIGERGGYYVKRFEKIIKDPNSIMWNWSAFFSCYFWFFYRRMPKVGILFMLAIIPYMLIVMAFIKSPIFWLFFWALAAAVCAFTADVIYKKFVIDFMKKNYLQEKKLDEHILKKQIVIQTGKPSMTNVIIAGLVTAIIVGIVVFLYMLLNTVYIF